MKNKNEDQAIIDDLQETIESQEQMIKKLKDLLKKKDMQQYVKSYNDHSIPKNN